MVRLRYAERYHETLDSVKIVEFYDQIEKTESVN
jgi:hypothetical protein